MIDDDWTCEACTSKNPESFLCCDVCGTQKPEEESIQEISERLLRLEEEEEKAKQEAAKVAAASIPTKDGNNWKSVNGSTSKACREEKKSDPEAASETTSSYIDMESYTSCKLTQEQLQGISKQVSNPKLANILLSPKTQNPEGIYLLLQQDQQTKRPPAKEEKIMAWVLLVLVRDDVDLRLECLAHAEAFSNIVLQFQQLQQQASKSKGGGNTTSEDLYTLQALRALTIAYLLPCLADEATEKLKVEIKQVLQFLCSDCSKPICVTSKVCVSVAEMKCAGDTRGKGRLRMRTNTADTLKKTANHSPHKHDNNKKSEPRMTENQCREWEIPSLLIALPNETDDINRLQILSCLVQMVQDQQVLRTQLVTLGEKEGEESALMALLTQQPQQDSNQEQQHSTTILAAMAVAYFIIECSQQQVYCAASLSSVVLMFQELQDILTRLTVIIMDMEESSSIVTHRSISAVDIPAISLAKLRYLCVYATLHLQLQLQLQDSLQETAPVAAAAAATTSTSCGRKHGYESMYQRIQSYAQKGDTKSLADMFVQEQELVLYPRLQVQVLAWILKFKKSPQHEQMFQWQSFMVEHHKDVITLLLEIFYTSPTDAMGTKTVAALVVAELLQPPSDFLLLSKQREQQAGIKDCVDYLTNAQRDVAIFRAPATVPLPPQAVNTSHNDNNNSNQMHDSKLPPILVNFSLMEIAYAGEAARRIVAEGPIRTATVVWDGGSAGTSPAADSVFALAEPMATLSDPLGMPSLHRWTCQDCNFAENFPAMHRCGNCKKLRYHANIIKFLLDSLAEGHETLSKMELALMLMHHAEQNPKARDEMIDFNALEVLVAVFKSHKDTASDRELAMTAALTIAYILRSCYPRKVPMTKPRRLAILDALNFLRDSKRDVILEEGETIMRTKTLQSICIEARNYFVLIDSQEMRELKSQAYGVSGKKKTADENSKKEQEKQLEFALGHTVGTADINIESAVFYLGSADLNRKMDAVLALIRHAKEAPTQRALMQNYGVVTRLLDIVRSRDDKTEKLRTVAALAIAFILPSVNDITMSGFEEQLKECLKILRCHSSRGQSLRSLEIYGQDLVWAIDSLAQRLEQQEPAEQTEADHDGQDFATRSELSLQIDLEELYQEKEVKVLLELIHTRSCRILDAVLLLFVLAEREKGVLDTIHTYGGVEILLGVFSSLAGSWEDLRFAAAMIISLLLSTNKSLSSEVQERMSACDQLLQENKPTMQRIAVKAANKVDSPARFKLEPTKYNFEENGVTGEVIANSLGLKCGRKQFFWEGISTCEIHTDTGPAVKIILENGTDEAKDHYLVNVQNIGIALDLKEDVLGRLRVFRKSHHAKKNKNGNDRVEYDKDKPAKPLRVPPVIDIACADRPEFLGVSVYHLVHVFLPQIMETPDLSEKSLFYDIEDLKKDAGYLRKKSIDAVCPVDGRMSSAYVHTLNGDDHVGLANHMLSWTWKYSVLDVVTALESYCNANELDPRRTYVWICCLCLNQHRIAESTKSGVSSDTFLGFENEFRQRVIGVGRLLVLMRPWGDPDNLKRIWCIFEIFMALIHCEMSIVMPPREKELLTTELLSSPENGIATLYKALKDINVEKAKASVEHDRGHILSLIHERIGFNVVNRQVRDRLRGWVRGVIDEWRATYEQESSQDDPLHYCSLLKQVGDVYEK